MLDCVTLDPFFQEAFENFLIKMDKSGDIGGRKLMLVVGLVLDFGMHKNQL